MKLLKSLSTTLLAALAWAPATSAWSCLSDNDAYAIIDRQKIFIAHQNVTLARLEVETLFAANITEYSDSVNALRGRPVSHHLLSFNSSYGELY